MNASLQELCQSLEASIKDAYESSVTVDDAERLAAKFLYGQMQVAQALRSQDLDARMKKSGLKAIKAAVYLAEVGKAEKKPTEAALTSLIDTDGLVQDNQNLLDTAEVDRDLLKSYFDIFNNAHIHFRGVAKGSL